jgi:hypothetical protein
MKPSNLDLLVKQVDANLVKDLTKLLGRIERIFVPSGTMVYNPVIEKLEALMKEVQKGSCIVDVKDFSREEIDRALSKNSEFIIRKVDWDIFVRDLVRATGNGDVDYQLPPLVLEEIDTEIRVHNEKMNKALAKEKIRQLQVRIATSIILRFKFLFL